MNAGFTITSIWELLAVIAGIEIVVIPGVVAIFNGIFAGYFRAKESYTAKMINALGKVLAESGEKIKKEIVKE